MTSTTKAPGKGVRTLAPFSHDWVGGDIAGLASFARTLADYVPRIGDVVTALDEQVARLVSDAGWQGTAASAFSRAWQPDAVGATALGTVIGATADICDWLASKLSVIENALEKAANVVSAHGVPIGPDGQPFIGPLAGAEGQWRQAYDSFWNDCMADAMRARISATSALQRLYAKIAPPDRSGGSGGLQPGDYNTLGDYLRGFWALPAEKSKQIRELISDQENEVAQAKTALAGDRDALGRFTARNDFKEHLGDLKGAQTELAGLEDELKAAQANENVFTKAMDFSVHDIPAFSGKEFSGILKAAADAPFVDIASTGLGAYLNVKDDLSHGVSPYVAAPGETAGGAASVAGADAVAEALGAAAPLEVSVGVTGIAAWGIGDVVHNAIKEPWEKDIMQHPQLVQVGDEPGPGQPALPAGALYGAGHTLVNTGKDGWHLAQNTGAGIWHGLHALDEGQANQSDPVPGI